MPGFFLFNKKKSKFTITHISSNWSNLTETQTKNQMPLANNYTGQNNADAYSPQNQVTVTGILSPTDGDVYVYGYDQNKKQYIVRKIRKQAQIPHKGISAHPVFTNNLLAGYRKHAAQPVVGSQQPVFNWVDKDRFKQQLQNLSVNPRTGALHGVRSGMQINETWTAAQKERFKQQLSNMSANPVSGALNGVSKSMMPGFAWSESQKKAFRQQLSNMSASLKNGALHGVPGKGGSLWAKTGKFATTLTQNKSILPKNKTGALHGKAGPGGAGGGVLDALKSVLGFGGSSWPVARFHFYVMIGGTELGFQTVEGLEASVGVIEYRDGNSPFFGKEKMPGLITYEKVTLKKGVFSNDTNANSWFKEIAQDRLYTKRRTIIIAMMDHSLVPQFIWRYQDCFLTKVTPSNLDAESDSEVAIEEIEFVGRAWYLDTLAGAAMGALGAVSGAAGVNVNLNF
jgi:phage tail-like protein